MAFINACRSVVRREPVQDADAEVEAIQQHIEKHTQRDNRRPDRHQVGNATAHDCCSTGTLKVECA